MKAKKEDWIADVMSSVDEIHPAEPNPFLYEKIVNRMSAANRQETFFTRRMVTRLSVGFVLLIIMNLISIKQYRSGTHRNQYPHFSLSEYDSLYNYNY
jgi:hypothetical protein